MKVEYFDRRDVVFPDTKKKNVKLNEKISYNTHVAWEHRIPDRMWIYFFEEGYPKCLLVSGMTCAEEIAHLRPDTSRYNGYLDDCQSLEDVEERIAWLIV